jgi:SAM-dependent methyltransferase
MTHRLNSTPQGSVPTAPQPSWQPTWNRLAATYTTGQPPGWFSRQYHALLGWYYRRMIPPGARVLEVGCGAGDVLAALPDRDRTGIDLFASQLELARQQVPEAHLDCAAGESYTADQPFDFIVLSDLLNEVADVQRLLENLHGVAHPGTRLMLNIHNTLWRPVLSLASLCGLRPRRAHGNWLSCHDVDCLLDLAGWRIIRWDARILVPLHLLGVGRLLNAVVAPLLPWFALALFAVARPRAAAAPAATAPHSASVSVIIPARNEAGNIAAAVAGVPDMGSATEILIVEGNSQDDTWAAIQQAIAAHPQRTIRALRQDGKGKGNAMRTGYAAAQGDILMILDADLTVPPDELPKFYQALVTGKAEFANGSRLIYPMEADAMRFLNLCANRFFGALFSWLIGQPVKDTLCGTKVFWRRDYLRIAANRAHFGEFDPFGDFDLLFGAAHLNLDIVDIPVRYRARAYGETQIHRWRDGWLLLRMAAFAARKLKFV